MSCIQIPISGFSPLSRSAPARRRRLAGPSVVRCHFQESEGAFNWEDPPESLFMRELRRRGMAPMTPIVLPSMPEELSMVLLELELLEGLEIEVQIEKEGLARMTRRMKRAAAWEEFDGGMAGECRELDDEQLEGFIPRAKLLLTIGMYFLGSGPLIMITFMFFAALYLYFGPSFLHDASKMSLSPPPYGDPYVAGRRKDIPDGSTYELDLNCLEHPKLFEPSSNKKINPAPPESSEHEDLRLQGKAQISETLLPVGSC